jgi:hypothetical protein
MWWVNIEVPSASINKDSKKALACYPYRTFDLLFEIFALQ